MNVALIILNKDYSCARGYSNLPGVTKDGVVMKEMLSRNHEVKTVENATKEGIDQALKQILDNQRNIETLHFHYSGHGVDNCIVEMNSKNEVVNPTGDCMVGCDGELYSVLDLKHELLACNPARVIVTLDCCRSCPVRGGRLTVKLRHREKISIPDLKKIAVIQGACELHAASDGRSFTQELYKVVTEEGGKIPILKIASKVNQSWEDAGVQCRGQLCTLDIKEVGDSWTIFMWPGLTGEEKLKRDLEKLREADEQMSDQDFYNFVCDIFPTGGYKKREITTRNTKWAAYSKLRWYYFLTQAEVAKYGDQYQALCREIFSRVGSRYNKMWR